MENIEEKAVEQEVVEQAEEKNVEQETGSIKIKRPRQFVQTEEDNVVKIDLRKKPEEDAIQEQSADDSDDAVEEPGNEESGEEVVEEVRDTEQEEQPVLEEIKEEEVEEEQKQTEEVEAIEEKVEEAVEESKETGEPLPENIQKVVDFINDTGGSLEDYVRLNQDYSKLNETQLIREYYETTKPHLDREDIDLLMEDFSYDEELDEPKTIRKAKIAFKEEAAKAKNHLESLKTKYYEEVKAGSRLTSDQQKAVDFFNRYNKEQKETSEVAERQKSIFLNKTNDLFSKDFKGFDYSVGDKKYRFNIKDVDAVKESQSDLNNFVKKFLNKNNEMENASEYHKSLFTAMNPDSVAKHFYEQGKADAIKESMARTKNVDMAPRGTHEQVTSSNGWTVKAVNGEDTSRLRIKIKK